MEMGLGSTLLPGDPRLIDHIVGEVKSQGIFDQFRKDALADVDTKPAYQNLRTRVEGSVNSFLSKQTWKADLNKNQLRETLRKHISDAAYLDAGVERIVDQVVNPKIYSVFLPQVEDVVYKYLGLEKPKREKNGGTSIKDLLPIDLDPVSPESDKNSLKDVSLDSIDDLELSNKDNNDQVDNAESSHVTDYEKSIEEKEEKDSKELVENEVNGTDLIQSMEEEKPTCSTPPLVDIGLNDSIKSDEKTEEEEEDSPVFEPIDVINFHESNVSNDSHLSGISELTSHRSRSPDFQINEFSRDHFDFSNQDSQFSKVSSDSRLSIVTDFGSSNQASTPVPDPPKEEKSIDKNYDDKSKDKVIESRDSNKNSKSSSSKEREKNDYKSKSSKERSDSRDSRSHRDRDYKKKSTDSKSDRDKSRSSRDSNDKSKEKDKDSKDKIKDEKSNSGKDLKDIYKEKIRELREKKELTEKEKLNKDKDGHRSRDSRDKKDSKDSKDSSKDSKDRRDSKEHRSSSSSSRSHRHESSSRSKRDDSKSIHDKKKDDRHSRDKSRSQGESDGKRSSKDDKDKDSKSQRRKESRSDDSRKSSDKSSTEKEKDKDKKRREEKKSKSKDDHSSLHKSSNDRRSSDRDGSSGSNSKSSKNSCPGSSTSSKPNSSLKETGNTSNSSSETSDGVDEAQMEECHNVDAVQENIKVDRENGSSGVNAKRVDLGQSEISLPLKKRPLHTEGADSLVGEIKKPKLEENFKETANNNEQVVKIIPENERVQIIEVYEPQDDDDENEPYPDDADINLKLEQSSGVIMEGENIFKINIDNCKSNLSEMEMSIRESLNEMIVDKIMDTVSYENKEADGTFESNIVEVNDCNVEEKKIVSDSEGEDCLYLEPDEESERLIRFRQFLKSQNISYYGEDENFINNDGDDNNDDDIDDHDEKIEQLVPNEENQESALATMAPPQLKRKHSTSPLSDIVLNLDNNNDGHKDMDSVVGDLEKDKKSEKDKETGLGKKKLGRPKRQRPSVSSSSPNDDFIMPLSPESDVSATSDKFSANHKDKDDKRLKSKQRYTSDDLYKPRPLFVGSSRRNRRSNPA
ncbi:biorientation of chromosomes in cell division protein 1-like 1 [Cotesia glomerata]|uniref:BOD1/SHG1 domain-containing protein n=1 Tax=Cotesia glomerata TaxID=32391 RepID=A0AAV7IUY5_COTGL|nr:biorientation of chromosomes in cell division protein 1-like 1 [Cotesia glomerata]KAH0557898.1 hypothetical protein KQX54_012625 [Cotesia glomerata]